MATPITEQFRVETSDHSLGYNKPQTMGRRLWLPMTLMAVVAFPIALVFSWIRAAEIASSGDAATGGLIDAARLGHLVAAFGFIGFMAVFAAISFAIARVLGNFRKGGGEVQEAVGNEVLTLEMPVTAKVFTAFMMMGMMTMAVAVVLHFGAAAAGETWSLESHERWALVLEGLRRIGVVFYLFGIAFGLGTIIQVLRFQAIRIRELAARHS